MSTTSKTPVSVEFNTGFEFEFASPLDQNNISEQLRAAGHNAVRVDRTQRVWDGTNRVFVTRDGSVEATDRCPHQIEIVTSPRPLNESIYEMGKMLNFITEIGGVTNASTGLHIGVSFINPIRQHALDPIKMLYHLPEEELLTTWNRKNNRYCRALKGGTIDNLVMGYLSGSNMPKLLEWQNIKDIIVTQRDHAAKYYTANLLKLVNGYVEFRFMGGRDYHTKVEQILRSIKVVLNAMNYGADAAKDRDGYRKWIKGLHMLSWKQNLEHKTKQIAEYERAINGLKQNRLQIEQLINS